MYCLKPGMKSSLTHWASVKREEVSWEAKETKKWFGTCCGREYIQRINRKWIKDCEAAYRAPVKLSCWDLCICWLSTLCTTHSKYSTQGSRLCLCTFPTPAPPANVLSHLFLSCEQSEQQIIQTVHTHIGFAAFLKIYNKINLTRI